MRHLIHTHTLKHLGTLAKCVFPKLIYVHLVMNLFHKDCSSLTFIRIHVITTSLDQLSKVQLYTLGDLIPL